MSGALANTHPSDTKASTRPYFSPLITSSCKKFPKMSKRRITHEGVQYIGTPLTSITASQLAALQEARSALPPGLESLSPLLESILATYEDVVPPHARPIAVSV